MADGAEQLREILPKGEAWAEAAVAFGGETRSGASSFQSESRVEKGIMSHPKNWNHEKIGIMKSS